MTFAIGALFLLATGTVFGMVVQRDVDLAEIASLEAQLTLARAEQVDPRP